MPGTVVALSALAGVEAALVCGRIGDGPVGIFAQAVSLAELAGTVDAAMTEPARWLRVAVRPRGEAVNGRICVTAPG